MLRTTILVGSLASAALGSVANICAVDLYRQMQDYRDSEPAMDFCSSHYAAKTVVKTLPATCLTTTKTVILGTSTVHATTHMACPTTDAPHPEIRDVSEVEEREAFRKWKVEDEPELSIAVAQKHWHWYKWSESQ
jgi:hypothetical protein